MSIFSTIKYPITIAFEREHLALLPMHVLIHWWGDCIEWQYKTQQKVVNIPAEPARISSYIRNHTDKRSRAQHLQTLQQMIFNIDEP